ncbi:hypothetical protein D3C77_366800 [compost metagenome]
MTTAIPSRLIIDDRQIMVVLDTSPGRELAHEVNCPDWASTFEKMSREGYSFSLADGTFAELINQRRNGQLSVGEFERMCSRLSRFLNLDFPVILGRSDVLGMSQLNSTSWNEEECRVLSQQAWDELLRCTQNGYTPKSAESLLEAARAEWRSMLKGWQHGVDSIRAVKRAQLDILRGLDGAGLLMGLMGMPVEQALKTLDTLRTLSVPINEEFIAAFQPIPTAVMERIAEALQSIDPANLPGILDLHYAYEMQKAHVSASDCDPEIAWAEWMDERLSWKVIGPQISEGFMKSFQVSDSGEFTENMRSHLELVYCWRQFARMQQTKNGYDPDNDQKRNDGIDFDLYRFLKLRALVVTEDRAFLTGLSDIKSYQAAWFYTPRNLASRWAGGKSSAPAWPQPKHLAKR